MYPASFPKVSPFLRIVNPSVHHYAATNMYKKTQSKTDPQSYLLDELLQLKTNWKPDLSVVILFLLRPVLSLK